jgi:wyosine [tRNA(Phe)-imidazoG37] synthetase (radical SAM superfamily)
MATFLFDKTVFGPVKSRRLGISLGINLLPNDRKFCTYNCIYCECGWNPDPKGDKPHFPTREKVFDELKTTLEKMQLKGELPDVITFAGNGEPTIHPQFAAIIDDTLLLRNRFTPKTKIAVLSNSTMLHKPEVVTALKKVDDAILKLDTANTSTFEVLNSPEGYLNFNEMIENLIVFGNNAIIQTLFIRGEYNGKPIDNTSQEELGLWLDVIKKINPRKIMIYTIARDTPVETLQKVSKQELDSISSLITQNLGIEVEVSG